MKDFLKDWEDVEVTIIVDDLFAVMLEVEVVDHVDVAEVGSGGFVSNVDGVTERERPDGESFELGISSVDAFLVFVIKLREAGGEFAGAGAGGRNDDERSGRLDVRIGAIAFVGNDGGDIGGVAFGESVKVGFDFVIFELAGEIFGFFLAVEEGDDDGADVETASAEEFDETEDFGLVGNHVIGANLGVFDGVGVDAEDDFGFVLEFLKETDFEVGEESREGASGVLIVD